jgi:hypothetical protein
MSDYGDTGYDGGDSYGHYEAGQEHENLDQLHQASGSEQDYASQFGVYEADHASAENTSFDQGHQVQYDSPDGGHYEESDYTSYDHSAAETDHVFAAEGSEQYHASEWNELDALHHQLDTAFASATELNTVSA